MSSNLKAQLKVLLERKEYTAAIALLETSTLPDKQTYIQRIKARMADESAPPAAKPKSKPAQSKGRSPLYYGLIAVLVIILVGLIALIATSSNLAGYTPLPTVAGAGNVQSTVYGKWRVSEDTSAFDDSPTVVLLLDSDNSVQTWLDVEVPTLVLRCKEKKLEAYINVDSQFAVEIDEDYNDSPTVRLRFDDDKAYEIRMHESTDGEAVFFPDGEGLIRRMETASTLVFGFTPFSASPVQANFDLRGLKNVIQPLWAACD